jgi:hypothetical protein
MVKNRGTHGHMFGNQWGNPTYTQGGLGFEIFCCCSQCVSIKFSMGSQNILLVPNVFPNLFLIPPYFIPYPFALSCALVTQYNQPELKGRHYNIFVFWDCTNFDWVFCDEAIKDVDKKWRKNKRTLGSSQLINIRHIMLGWMLGCSCIVLELM